MAEYDNNLTGVLYRNDKGDNPKRPDYRGSIDVNGEQFWISGWIRESGPKAKNPGEKFMSLKLEPKEAQPAAPSHGVQKEAFDDGSDIPF